MTGPNPQLLSADSLKDNEVKSPAGEDIGSLKEIMLDTDSGRIAYAVLSVGGWLGMGDKLFAVPWNALTLDTKDKCFRMAATKEMFEASEGFDKDNWPNMADRSWGASNHKRFNQQPYWA